MSMQLFVLGLLRAQPLHPYQIKKDIIHNNWADIVNLNDGILYYAIDVLNKKQHIEVLEIIEEENRPKRTVYQITESGKEQLVKEIYKNLKIKGKLKPLYSALLFIDYADKDIIIATIKKRIVDLDKTPGDTRPLLAYDGQVSPITELITTHALQHLAIEKTWLENLLLYIEGR